MVSTLQLARLSRCAVVLAALVMTGCGGSSEEESYPELFAQYGGTGTYPILNMATFAQEYAWSDGTARKHSCRGIIRVLNQEGPAWSARAERGSPSSGCYSSGEMAGEVDMDRSIRFTLTQERWRECTALGPGEYAGQLDKNRFYAVGTIRVRCDDGRDATITETMFGDFQAPEGSHDT